MSDRSKLKQKASKWTPFVFITQILITPPIFANNCDISQRQSYEIVHVAHVYDGDTIKLVDGRKLRLIGINTPERGRDGKINQPFYRESKSQLQQIVKNNNAQLKIVIGKEIHDRYKRLLAHPFTMQGKNISAMLLEKGMGFSIAIPPNIHFISCYQKAENEAQKLRKGIWSHPYSHVIESSSISNDTLGFHRVKGRVQRIGESSSSFWLNLNSKFALRIMKHDLPYFEKFHPNDLLNRQVVAQGWIIEKNRGLIMSIRHPASLQLQETD